MRFIIALLILLIPTPALADNDPWLGPMRFSSQSAFLAPRLNMRPRAARVLPAGEIQVHLIGTWTNSWGYRNHGFQDSYVIDYEVAHTSMAFTYGLFDSSQIELEVSTHTIIGGAMDPIIKGFHDMFNIGQNGRDYYDNSMVQMVLPGVGNMIEPGDTIKYIRAEWIEEVLPSLSIIIASRVQSNGDLLKEMRTDPANLGAFIAFDQARGKWNFTFNMGYVWHNRFMVKNLEFNHLQFWGMVSAEYSYKKGASFIFQLIHGEGGLVNLDPFDRPSKEIIAGWKYQVDNLTVEFGVIENVAVFDNSPDFGFHLGLTIEMNDR